MLKLLFSFLNNNFIKIVPKWKKEKQKHKQNKKVERNISENRVPPKGHVGSLGEYFGDLGGSRVQVGILAPFWAPKSDF